MVKKSKNRKPGSKEKARAFNAQFAKPLLASADSITGLPGASLLIDSRVAINPSIIEKLDDTTRLQIIFDDYNNDECELSQINPSQAKSLVKKLQEVTDCSLAKIPTSGLIRDNVSNTGKYKGLYSKLSSPDIELKEGSLAGPGRIFFHIVERFFCVVAIKAKHINTDK